MFAAKGKVHGALTLQAGIAVVGRTAFGLVNHFVFVCSVVVPLIGSTVTVFPVVAIVEDSLEINFMIGIDFPIQGQ